jgi:hypothetical protein
MAKEKKIVERVSSGDTGFDTAINKFLPKGKVKATKNQANKLPADFVPGERITIKVSWDVNHKDLLTSFPAKDAKQAPQI